MIVASAQVCTDEEEYREDRLNSLRDDNDDNNNGGVFNNVTSNASMTSLPGTHAHTCKQCPYSTRIDSEPPLERWQKLRQDTHVFLEDPTSSTNAQVWSMFILVTILLSIVTFVMESFEEISDWRGWFIFESCIVALFTGEYLARLACASHLVAFISNPLNIIDVFAVLPYFIELAGGSSSVKALKVFRIIRLARVFRVFKLSRYSSYTKVVSQGFLRSTSAFRLMIFWLSLAVIISSTLVYFAERGSPDKDGCWRRSDGNPSPFRSIFASFYWSMVTLCTIGYGEITPIEPLGKFVASCTALCGILVIALPVTVLGSNFEYAYQSFRQQQKVRTVLREYSKSDDPALMEFQAAFSERLQTIKQCRKELTEMCRDARRMVIVNARLRAHGEGTRTRTVDDDLQLWGVVETGVINGLRSIEKFSATINMS